MAWPATPLDVEVSLYLAGVWVDITDYVREQQKVVIARGRRQRTGLPVAGRCTLTLDNTDGRFASRNPSGAYYGSIGRNTKLRVRINNGSGYVTRFFGYVPGWPPRWDASGNDQTVSITAVGILDRLGRGVDQRSALYRTLSGVDADGVLPLFYYPCEELATATEFASAVTGVGAFAIPPGVTPAADSSLPGSDPLPTWDVERYTNFPVPAYTSTGQWIARWVVSVPAVAPGGAGYIARFNTQGTITHWALILEPGSPDQFALRGYDINGNEIATAIVGVDSGDLSSEDEFYGHTFMVAVAVYQSGGNVVGQLTATRSDGLQMDVDSGSVAGTAGALIGNVVLASVIDGQAMGHLSGVVDPAFDIAAYFAGASTATSSTAMSGHAGEMAHVRWLRHGVEGGIATTTSATTSAAMGPQLSRTVLDDLEDIQATDLGRIIERIDDEGLDYLATSQMYGATAAITLAYDNAQVLPPWDPQDDQQEYRNDITARRPNGGSYRAVDQDEVDAYGLYATSVSPNVHTDNQLADVAGWLVHLGTLDELIWPAVRPNFYDHPTLLDDWLASDLGDQLWVTGHPSPLAPDTIKQVIEGYTETLGSYMCEVTAILSPASPYTVAVVEDDIFGRADTAGMELLVAATSSATTLTAVTTDGPIATTDAGEYPVDLRLSPDGRLSGEVVTATACASWATDSFARTVAAGSWGSPDVGPAYTHLFGGGGGSSQVSVSGGYGRHVHGGVNRTIFSLLGSQQHADFILNVQAAVSTTASYTERWIVRAVDASNYVAFGIVPGGAGWLPYINVVVGGVSVANASDTSLSLAATTGLFTLRASAVGDVLSVKLYTTGGTEPTLGVQLVNSAMPSGALGFMSFASASAVTFTAAYLTATNPQTLTVSRSVNDVSRAWAAGTQIALASGAKPAY